MAWLIFWVVVSLQGCLLAVTVSLARDLPMISRVAQWHCSAPEAVLKVLLKWWYLHEKQLEKIQH